MTDSEAAALLALYDSLAARKQARRLACNKRRVTLRLDADTLAHFRSGGRFWQRRINEALRRAMERDEG